MVYFGPFEAECPLGSPRAELRNITADEDGLSKFDSLAEREMYFMQEERSLVGGGRICGLKGHDS